MVPTTVDEVITRMSEQGYVTDRGLAVAILLSLELGRPLFLEGEAGVGKTEVAKVLAGITGGRLIRLQCYEGLDVNHALYEWDYARQMLAIRLIEARGTGGEASVADIMSREFLTPRPLLSAVEEAAAGLHPVLLIDELDRADEEFEAFLLEVLSDFQVTIPEVGTIKADTPPVVVVTSNRTREIHDALKRRCIYHWLDYPSVERELQILRLKQPDVDQRLGHQLARAMADMRSFDLFKPPGVAETLDWSAALRVLGAQELTPGIVDETLGVVLKYREDLEEVRRIGVDALIHQ
jgi:MoxR-like ATPase